VLHSEQIGVLLIPSTFYLDIKTVAYFDAKHHCKVGKNFATLAIVSLAGARMHKCELLSVKRACQRRCDFVVFRRIGDVEKRVGIVDSNEQHSGYGNDRLFVSPALFESEIAAADFRELLGTNSAQGALD